MNIKLRGQLFVFLQKLPPYAFPALWQDKAINAVFADSEIAINRQGALQAAERRFFIVENSDEMRYNKLLPFLSVTEDFGSQDLGRGSFP